MSSWDECRTRAQSLRKLCGTPDYECPHGYRTAHGNRISPAVQQRGQSSYLAASCLHGPADDGAALVLMCAGRHRCRKLGHGGPDDLGTCWQLAALQPIHRGVAFAADLWIGGIHQNKRRRRQQEHGCNNQAGEAGHRDGN